MKTIVERHAQFGRSPVAAITEAIADIDSLRSQLAAAKEESASLQRELERWRHGATIEGDFVCPHEAENTALRAVVDVAVKWHNCFDEDGEIKNRIHLGDVEVELDEAVAAHLRATGAVGSKRQP